MQMTTAQQQSRRPMHGRDCWQTTQEPLGSTWSVRGSLEGILDTRQPGGREDSPGALPGELLGQTTGTVELPLLVASMEEAIEFLPSELLGVAGAPRACNVWHRDVSCSALPLRRYGSGGSAGLIRVGRHAPEAGEHPLVGLDLFGGV